MTSGKTATGWPRRRRTRNDPCVLMRTDRRVFYTNHVHNVTLSNSSNTNPCVHRRDTRSGRPPVLLLDRPRVVERVQEAVLGLLSLSLSIYIYIYIEHARQSWMSRLKHQMLRLSQHVTTWPTYKTSETTTGAADNSLLLLLLYHYSCCYYYCYYY